MAKKPDKNTTKSRVILYIAAPALIGVIALLIVLLAMIAGGALDATQKKLVFSSASQDFVYDGAAHTSGGWELVDGELEEGHEAVVTVTGTCTEVGSAPNYLTAVIVDEGGNDVSGKYEIEYQPGALTVTPRQLTVVTGSAAKVYDGTPLTCADYTVYANGALLAGHTVTAVTLPVSRTDAGVSYNTAGEVTVLDEDGNNVSVNYSVYCVAGTLNVIPRTLTVRSGSASKAYDGTALTCDTWEVTSNTQPVEGQTVSVFVSGTRTEVGESPNTIAEVVIMDGETDVSHNYDIKTELGVLMVTGGQGGSGELPGGGGSGGGEGELPGGGGSGGGEGELPGGGGSGGGEGELPGGGDGPGGGEGEFPGGEGGGGGGGSPSGGDLNDSGDISGGVIGDGGGDPVTALRVYSDEQGKIYLRLKSFGDYDGASWGQAPVYDVLLDDTYCLNYLTGIALSSAGYESTFVRVEVYGTDYYLPYYMATGDLGDYEIQTDDTRYSGDTSQIYSLYYYLYDYVQDGAISPSLGAYSAAEQAYREYVYRNYMAVPQSTAQFLQGIIDEQGFSLSDSDIVGKVAAYIQGAATYNLEYDRALDEEEDIVVAFLQTYKEGICQHYASAATLLFRTLGLPARYTIGYVGDTVEGDWVEITTQNAHAWVEVYIDGTGWVNVEVTGGGPSFGDGTGGSGGGAGGENIELPPNALSIKPINEYMLYDGTSVLRPSGTVQGIADLLAQGYTYSAVVSGEQKSVGFGESKIESFVLYDPNGMDVTNQYDITYGKGRLQVYLQELTVTTYGGEKVYDGTPLINSEYLIEGTYLSGHSLSALTTTGTQLHAGSSLNAFNIIITDAEGNDVTYMYKINAVYGTLRVLPREITVTADSAEAVYTDGSTALICSDYTITSDYETALAAGDVAEVTVTGSQTNVGYSSNVVGEVKITDADGNDVTSDYVIVKRDGTLRVNPPQQG